MGAIKQAQIYRSEKMLQIERARAITRSLGARTAGGYLRNRGWSVEGAAYIVGTAAKRK